VAEGAWAADEEGMIFGLLRDRRFGSAYLSGYNVSMQIIKLALGFLQRSERLFVGTASTWPRRSIAA
jgi:hypothetical protein